MIYGGIQNVYGGRRAAGHVFLRFRLVKNLTFSDVYHVKMLIDTHQFMPVSYMDRIRIERRSCYGNDSLFDEVLSHFLSQNVKKDQK